MLLTGFDAFGETRETGHAANPSWLAARLLDGEEIGGRKVVAARLPTVFGTAWETLERLIEQHRPALILCVGLAGGRSALSIERVAINLMDARIPDNAGHQPKDEPIVSGAPAAYFSSLPVRNMLQAVVAAGLPAELSQSAGTFVCNHVFYRLMHRLANDPALASTRGGFVHVPFLPEQGSPSLALASVVQGLRILLASAVADGQPVR